MNKLLSIFSKNRLFKKKTIFNTVADTLSDVEFRPSHHTDFIFIETIVDLDVAGEKVPFSKGIIITTLETAQITGMLQAIRTHSNKEIYLKPIFLTAPTTDKHLQSQVDGIYTPKSKQVAKETADFINQRIGKIKKSASTTDAQDGIIVKTVQYLYTRNHQKLQPFPHKQSNIGYAFPFLNSFFPLFKNDELLAFLQEGVKQSWLEETVIASLDFGGRKLELGEYALSFIGEKLAKEGYYEASEEKLPNGVIEPAIFQIMLDNEIQRSKRDGHDSFLIQISLIKKNLAFLPLKAHKELALECLEIAKNNFGGLDTLSFSADDKIWVLMPEISRTGAVKTVEQVFFYLQKLLHDNLDTRQSLVEINMYSVQQTLPNILGKGK